MEDFARDRRPAAARVDCPDDKKFEIAERAKEFFRKRYPIIDVDGVRIQFPEGWGLLRASNTQPALVLRFEAKTVEQLKEYRVIVEEKLRELESF